MTASIMLWTGVVVLGGVGAVLRFVVDRVVARRAARSFPFGTFTVNLTGAAALGFISGAAFSPHTAMLAGTAFVGSYTTFSTWMLETERLAEEHQIVSAVANLASSIIFGLGAVLLGQWIAGWI